MAESKKPFQALGARIKFLREQWQQSVREVSNSLEIKESTLKSIEDGSELPENDVLDLLISHFLLTDDQADELRDLADRIVARQSGYEAPKMPMLDDALSKQIVMYLAPESKVIYTDTMNANVNDHGVILQFMQSTGSGQPPTTVSKLGMSREHAEKMIKVLQHTLNEYDKNRGTKRLQNPKNDK